jgi:hypothetical protein
MNLICFPHYTCGGLLTDILNQTFSEVAVNGGINAVNHTLGKIGDSDTVFDQFDPKEFDLTVSHLHTICGKDEWIATHCWPGILDISKFNHVLSVTTNTYRSKLYRWIRAYYHYYEKSDPWSTLSDQARIDKERETAKNYLIPFLPTQSKNITNIEFAEVVETSTEFLKLTDGLETAHHMDRWKKINHFLYDDKLWNSTPLHRFYEAELETTLGRYYVYK